MARSRWNSAVALLAVLAMAFAVAAMASDDDEMMSLYQPRDPCPQVERIVKEAVDAEFKRNKQITAGLLRVFFHDCFSGGCDASIFLEEEWTGGVNGGSVQERVRELVNEIRVKVNKECGDKAVSCADILALATRDSVAAANGPRTPIFRGRFDSLVIGNVSKLPGPGQPISDLLNLFAEFGLQDPADLVALSGGHTVGRTKICFIVRPEFQQSCRANGDRQILDVITPDQFDNQYFVGLTRNQGVFASDQNLLTHPTTRRFVVDYARNKQAFFTQWATSLRKLSEVNWVTPRNGEIRVNCSRTNRGRVSSIMDADEGFAASA
ncbi:hypothetical protein QOZ80_6BG0460030 [Eleusine coracana subsp. coracana]|nr:hypothetical protein QOZ80_6BG0460030 [Eleusine coracana subsp. coracana]